MPSTAKEIVLEKYPQAEARHNKATYELGQERAIQAEDWTIYVGPGAGDRSLGSGATEAQAWTNASTKVLEDLRKPTAVAVSDEVLSDAKAVGVQSTLVDGIQDLADEGLKIKRTETRES